MRMFTPPTKISVCASQGVGGSMEFQSISSKKFLSKYFHLPIVDAAKELGMCTTMLKKLCRRCGISRWPYRKVNINNNNNSVCIYCLLVIVVEQKIILFLLLNFGIYFCSLLLGIFLLRIYFCSLLLIREFINYLNGLNY